MTPDGARLVHPDGAEAGELRYVERVRPLAGFPEIVRRVVADEGDVVPCGPSFELVTDEGEYGATVAVRSPRVHGAIGCVFLDDFYALAVATSALGPIADTLRQVLVTDEHMLGVRRRWFRYEVPAGWLCTRAGVYHRVFTQDGRTIVGFPALPRPPGRRDFAAWLAREQLARWNATAISEPCTVVARHGLGGQRWDADLGDQRCAMIVLEDARYAYALGFRAVDEAVIRETLATVEPLPLPRSAREAAGECSFLYSCE